MHRPGVRFASPTVVVDSVAPVTSAPPPDLQQAVVTKRQWNPVPPEYMSEPKSSTSKPKRKSKPSNGDRGRAVDVGKTSESMQSQERRRPGTAGVNTRAHNTSYSPPIEPEVDPPPVRKLSLPTKPPHLVSIPVNFSNGGSRAARLTSSSPVKRQQQLVAHDKQLKAEGRRDPLKSAVVLKHLRVQDVDADAVRPLIEIAYWSPFIEVRRDAAAALASLSRNAANLNMLFEMGTLGALVSMLGSPQDRNDSSIARDCAQTLSALVRLDNVKLLLLQAPDGLERLFTLLHSPDAKLKQIAYEVINNLVTIDETREAVAKREGFAFILANCTSKDSRLRILAASILRQLAASRENRVLFFHSNHFETLGAILCNPFLEKDPAFRRELLGFILSLLSEEENALKFTQCRLIPSVLVILDSPRTTYQVVILVVSIVEAIATNSRNHEALVAAGALPRLVQLCFSPGCDSGPAVDRIPLVSKSEYRQRPKSAVPRRGGSPRDRNTILFIDAAALTQGDAKSNQGFTRPATPKVGNSTWDAAENSTVLRTSFTIFCDMAKNPANREHLIRSKLLDCIASRNLYASPDKRIRRSVLTLLTLLICKEREHSRDQLHEPTLASPTISAGMPIRQLPIATSARRSSISPAINLSTGRLSLLIDNPSQFADAEAGYKHYIELLARGVVKCLFGILVGNDFSMKIDAIGAIAQLTEDDSSRLTMCKPQLLQSLKEFAFHPLAQTRYHIAKIIANFAEKPENCLKLVDEGMLGVLVKYISPAGDRHNDILFHATRAIAAMSKLHVSRGKLVESGVLGTLIQFCKSSATTPNVLANALVAIRNLRHDAAALRIQAIYRGWYVRIHQEQNNTLAGRKKRIRNLSSIRKQRFESSIGSVMDRFIAS